MFSQMEFDTHEDAYTYYKDYAKSAGFGTAKLSSRRSRASKEFIDAKFSCIRYGTKQQSDDAINPRASPKIGCKASMHVKRRPDGKWYVYSFVEEHNHELLPEQSHFFRSHRVESSDPRLRRNKRSNNNPLADCSKHLTAYHDLAFLDGYIRNNNNQHDRGRRLAIESRDAQILLEFLTRMQEENHKFFYAVDFNEDNVLRNVFWVDAKGIDDYKSFNDVVSFDTSYVVSKFKLPLVVFVGVNHHVQPVLLGCALVGDESVYSYVWLMESWLMAMGGLMPRVMLTDQDDGIKAAVSAVLPETRHCYCLWYVLDRFPRNLDYWGMWQDAFLKKFFKCVYGSWSGEEFDRRWVKLIDKFHLRDVQWMRCLYDERSLWAPTFMRGVTFAGMSTRYRSESVNSMFDRYVQCETSLKDFLEGYGMMLEDRYEEEAKADFDAWHEAPELKSPSPFEKQVLLVYTHVVFRRFQVEVLGAAACHLTKESEGGTTYSVKDFEDDQKYLVEWDESKSDIYCSCRSFEYKGYLCRHAIVVLQMSGVFTIPINYVLQRWTNAARNRHQISGNLELVQCNIRRFNDLCRRAVILGEEGSLSQESYDVAMFAMKEAFKLCAIKGNTIEHPTIDHIHENNQYGSTSKQIGLEHNIQHVGNAAGQGETIKEKRSSLNNTSKKAKHVTESGNVGEGSQEGFQHVVAGPRPFQAGLAAQFHNTIPAVFQNVIPTEFHNIQATNMHQNNPPG
ncbi:protein FAR1-RELATED SEQUENCE 4-like isoform X1 [Brassica napus]|uniref:protein FAR1-RELATED SEQUENCE 4-like isoform X1 n=1 Tax=Brassica napus TaxID=3708 RepID=UPI002079E920|nr:protein FAR1-RELATED SEQUENCE 4-like isoform X1 [Brassica napus]